MKWATRPQCHVDRVACAWLIRRFIDTDAEFVFVNELIDVPPDVTPFDMRGATLSHKDGGCTFECLLRTYDLEDIGLSRIAEIIHEADIGDGRYEAAEAPGVELTVRGLGCMLEDPELLEVTATMFDGIYASLKA
jgi:hypothetical protein